METERLPAILGFAIMMAFMSSGAVAGSATEKASVENPWIRSAPPMAKIMAGYWIIHNHSPQPITLTGVTSPAFKDVEIHRTEIMEGMAHMTPVAELQIAGHGSATFEPNGYHLMLIDPKKTLTRGDKVPLTLKFGDDITLEIEAEIRDGPNSHSHHHHH